MTKAVLKGTPEEKKISKQANIKLIELINLFQAVFIPYVTEGAQILNTENLNTEPTTQNFVYILPVNSSPSLNFHPIQGKVNLPHE